MIQIILQKQSHTILVHTQTYQLWSTIVWRTTTTCQTKKLCSWMWAHTTERWESIHSKSPFHWLLTSRLRILVMPNTIGSLVLTNSFSSKKMQIFGSSSLVKIRTEEQESKWQTAWEKFETSYSSFRLKMAIEHQSFRSILISRCSFTIESLISEATPCSLRSTEN